MHLAASSVSPFVLLTVQPDKQRLFQSILKPDCVSQKPRHFVSTVKALHPVTFSEQIAKRLQAAALFAETPESIPPGVREKVLSRLRCLQKVVARLPKHFCPYRATPEYKLTYYVETLACGHRQFAYPPNHVAKRRNCTECLKFESSPETGAPVVSVAGGSVRGNASTKSVPLPPFASSEKKPVHSATESEVISDERHLG